MLKVEPFSDGQVGRMLEELPEGVVVTDATGAVRWANRGAEEITGWTAVELRGMRLDQLIAWDELMAIARTRGVTDPWALGRCHCHMRTRSGERQEVSISMAWSSKSDRSATIFLLRDVRRQREVERRLARQLADKLEVEDLGRAASRIIHGLRNLCNVLSLTARTFRAYYYDAAFREEAIQSLEGVVREMKYLTERFSGAPARITLHRRRTLLLEIVQRALDLVARSGRPSEVAATEVRGLDQGFWCEVDVAEMQHVLFNLLLNAYEAVEDGGKVSLLIQHEPEQGQGRLIIEDTGPGFSHEFLETSLFRPFRSTKPGGLGLGLYHTKAIIEAHGGTIAVANRQEGRGARVTIILPVVPEKTAVSSRA